MTTPLQYKNVCRQQVRERMRALDEAELQRWSQEIQDRVMRLRVYQQAASVAVYLSRPDEVSTAQIVQDCRRQRRTLWLPAAAAAGGYRFLPWKETQALVEGPCAIPQPLADTTVPPQRPDLIIVPGRAFDRKGGRIGHGAGIYDRLLAAEPGCRLGLAFFFQLFDTVPVEDHDVRMHGIITDREMVISDEHGQMISEIRQQPE